MDAFYLNALAHELLKAAVPFSGGPACQRTGGGTRLSFPTLGLSPPPAQPQRSKLPPSRGGGRLGIRGHHGALASPPSASVPTPQTSTRVSVNSKLRPITHLRMLFLKYLKMKTVLQM